jgi:DNA-binding NarL/FixJ family response regulator
MKQPRLILADDHTLLLEAFRKLLEPHYDVVGTVSDGLALLESATEGLAHHRWNVYAGGRLRDSKR